MVERTNIALKFNMDDFIARTEAFIANTEDSVIKNKVDTQQMVDKLSEDVLISKAKMAQIQVIGASRMQGLSTEVIKSTLEGMAFRLEQDKDHAAAAAWRKAIKQNFAELAQKKAQSAATRKR